MFGQRSLTKRLARTVFFGAAPTIGWAHKGLEPSGCSSGTAIPVMYPVISTPRSTQLADRATYFYYGSGKYWYDLQANISRTCQRPSRATPQGGCIGRDRLATAGQARDPR